MGARIIPNSLLLKEKIINLTGGGKGVVSNVIFYIDYVFDVEKAKAAIESVVSSDLNVVLDLKRKREIRFLVRCKQWVIEIETLFWINAAENEEIIRSRVSELVKKELAEEKFCYQYPQP